MTDDKEILERMDKTFDEVRNIHEELKKRLHEDRERFQKGKTAEIELLTQYVEVFDKRSDMSHLVSSINSFNERCEVYDEEPFQILRVVET